MVVMCDGDLGFDSREGARESEKKKRLPHPRKAACMQVLNLPNVDQ